MPSKLILAMGRSEKLDEDGLHRFDGYLDVLTDGDALSASTFLSAREVLNGRTYREMIKRLAELSRSAVHREAQIFLLRLDQPNSIAVELEPQLAKMLREDPVAFMRLMDPTMGRPQKLGISTNVKREHSVAIKPNPLPSGHDTLADAFGDWMYCRMVRGGPAECPLCGRWGRWQMDAGLHCKECGVLILGEGIITSNGGWFRIKTPYLIEVAELREKTRVFLPRAWNKDGPWIALTALREKYNDFCKEREECSRIHKAGTSA